MRESPGIVATTASGGRHDSGFGKRGRGYPCDINGPKPDSPSDSSDAGFPKWVAWTIPVSVIVLLVIHVVSSAAGPDWRLERKAFSSLVLQSDEGPPGARHVGSSENGLDPGYRVKGEVAFHSIFSDLPPVEYQDGVWSHDFVDGAVYVTSSALWFDDEEDLSDFLWERWHDYTLHSTERQRGHDGSWLVFNPRYQPPGGESEAPIAAAAWNHGNVALIVLFVGAADSTAALQLAEIVQAHVETVQPAGESIDPIFVFDRLGVERP